MWKVLSQFYICMRKYLELDFVPSVTTLRTIFFPSVTNVLILNFELHFSIKVSWKLRKCKNNLWGQFISNKICLWNRKFCWLSIFSFCDWSMALWLRVHRQRVWWKALPRSIKPVFVSRNLVGGKLSRWFET